MRPGAGELLPDPITGPHCQGYVNGCTCPVCEDRRAGVASGDLFYDKSGALRWREDRNLNTPFALSNDRALYAYRRDMHGPDVTP